MLKLSIQLLRFQIFSRLSRESPARNYVTDVVTSRSRFVSARFSGAYSYKGVRYGSIPWAVQSARCMSADSGSGKLPNVTL